MSFFCIRVLGNGILSLDLVNLNGRVIAIAQEFFRDTQKEINDSIGVWSSVNTYFVKGATSHLGR